MISHNHSDLYFSCVVLLRMSLKEVALNLTKNSFSFLPTVFPFWFVEHHEYTPTSSWLPIRIVHFYFHFVIMAFFAHFLSYDKCVNTCIKQACSGPYWENVGPLSLLYGPHSAWSILSGAWADIFPFRPLSLAKVIFTENSSGIMAKMKLPKNLMALVLF